MLTESTDRKQDSPARAEFEFKTMSAPPTVFVSCTFIPMGTDGSALYAHPLCASGVVAPYLLETGLPPVSVVPTLAQEYHHGRGHSLVLGDDRFGTRLGRTLQSAALLFARAPPVALFTNQFVSESGSDDVGPVQNALQVICRDGTIVSYVFAMRPAVFAPSKRAFATAMLRPVTQSHVFFFSRLFFCFVFKCTLLTQLLSRPDVSREHVSSFELILCLNRPLIPFVQPSSTADTTFILQRPS
jgi:hypothetical protein